MTLPTKLIFFPARCSRATIDRVRRASYWTGLTVQDIVERALNQHVDRMERATGRKFRRIPPSKRLPHGPRGK